MPEYGIHAVITTIIEADSESEAREQAVAALKRDGTIQTESIDVEEHR